MYKGKIPNPANSKTPLSQIAQENVQLASLNTLEAVNRMRELYAAAISFADKQIGRILDELDAQGLTENTLVVFTSDHGEMLGDLGTYQKFLPYDASARIPLIMRWPGKIKAATQTDEFADLNDVLPTFLDAANVEYPASYDLPGESLLCVEGKKNRELQYVEHQRGSKRWVSMRNKRFKFVYYYGDKEELFDLEKDKNETTNLLHENPCKEALAARDILYAQLVKYEERYGLEGGIVNGEFKKMPQYIKKPHYEINFPKFPDNLMQEEKKQMNVYEDEILNAIVHEKETDLNKNNTREILQKSGRYSDIEIELLIEKAAKRNMTKPL